MRKILLAATVLVGGGLLASAPAHAVFVDSTSTFFTVPVQSTITFTFVGKSADDIDLLINGGTTIFNNQTAAVGATFITVFGPGQYTVQLRDTTQGTLYGPGAGNPDGQVHLKSTTTYADFNLGPVAPVAAGLNGYYGFEDRPIPGGGLTDFNDLIFTVTAVPTGGAIPEPMSLAVLGVGLVGVGVARMRKGKTKA